MRRLATVVAVAAAVLGGCVFGGDGRIEVTAAFPDVGDLAATAPVMLADVTIGEVTEIDLVGREAVVTMEIDPSAGVPGGVIARIRRTSVLGERIVDLAIPEGLPSGAPPLADGDRIAQTEVRADLEDLVVEGADVLAPIAAGEVATLVDEGAKGFGDGGEELATFLRNMSEIVRGFQGRTPAIRNMIRAMDGFNSTIATRADEHAASIANTARSLRVLREESEELTAAIRALDRLAVGGRGILEAHRDEMDRFFHQMHVILRVLDEEQGSIVQFLRWAPLHNRNTQITEFRDFVQVYQDFIICGLNDDPSDPARRCKEGG